LICIKKQYHKTPAAATRADNAQEFPFGRIPASGGDRALRGFAIAPAPALRAVAKPLQSLARIHHWRIAAIKTAASMPLVPGTFFHRTGPPKNSCSVLSLSVYPTLWLKILHFFKLKITFRQKIILTLFTIMCYIISLSL
jgi:hypothetical protein